jgi:hypothetical protein
MTQVTVRIDGEAERALAELMREDGKSRSQAVRDALLTVQRLRLAERLRRESAECRQDEADLAESRAVFDDMAERRAW